MRRLLTIVIVVPFLVWVMRQCRKPSGSLGRKLAGAMNIGHSPMTDWALSRISIRSTDVILDVGCGGGRTVQKLAALAPNGTVHGIDYSSASVATARQTNAAEIAAGRVHVASGSVASLPFADRTFDLVTAIETHYYWPDLPANIREVLRVLKPGGTFMIVAETSRDGAQGALYAPIMWVIGGKHLTRAALVDLLSASGFTGVALAKADGHGWISVTGRKP